MRMIDKLKERKIFNDYEIANEGDKDKVFVGYYLNGSRSCLPSWFSVSVVGKSYKDAAWYEHGAKTFVAVNSKDTDAFNKALRFASIAANCDKWVKTPFGGWVSRNTAEAIGLKFRKVYTVK